MSVTRGPDAVRQPPHTNDMRIATIVSEQEDQDRRLPRVKPTAFTATTLITTMTVLTASE